jgi:hypothetical protein
MHLILIFKKKLIFFLKVKFLNCAEYFALLKYFLILTLFFKKLYLSLSTDYTYKFLVNGLKFHLDTINLNFSDY